MVHCDQPIQPKTLMEKGVVRSDHAPNHLTLGFQLVWTCSLPVPALAVAGTTDCGVGSSEACGIACWPMLGCREVSLSGRVDPHSSDRIERTRRTGHLCLIPTTAGTRWAADLCLRFVLMLLTVSRARPELVSEMSRDSTRRCGSRSIHDVYDPICGDSLLNSGKAPPWSVCETKGRA